MLEGADDLAGRPSARRSRDPRHGSYYRRMRLLVLSVVVLLLALIAYVVVVYSPLFEIKRIVANPTEHVTSETISALAAVPSGSTLFSVDEAGVSSRLSANPWIASVTISRNFPDELVIEVQERVAGAVVMLANGSEAWLISTDGYWLESLALEEATSDNGVAAPADQAYAVASEEGLVYISEISALVTPSVGTACTDTAILGVLTYLETFSEELRSQIVSAKASSRESISVMLASGIEIALGAPTDIELKEEVALALLELYAGQITYVNVRVPTDPVWRSLDADAAADPDTGDEAETTQEDSDAAAEEETVDESASEDTSSAPTDENGDFVGTEEGASGGNLDEGGYYADDGVTWIYAYHDSYGNWINGYYDENGAWVKIS